MQASNNADKKFSMQVGGPPRKTGLLERTCMEVGKDRFEEVQPIRGFG